MISMESEFLKVDLAVEVFDRISGKYSGYYRARLGCVACGVDEDFWFNWPPSSVIYDGPSITSRSMLDMGAELYARTVSFEKCSHVNSGTQSI